MRKRISARMALAIAGVFSLGVIVFLTVSHGAHKKVVKVSVVHQKPHDWAMSTAVRPVINALPEGLLDSPSYIPMMADETMEGGRAGLEIKIKQAVNSFALQHPDQEVSLGPLDEEMDGVVMTVRGVWVNHQPRKK